MCGMRVKTSRLEVLRYTAYRERGIPAAHGNSPEEALARAREFGYAVEYVAERLRNYPYTEQRRWAV